jgi:hypothetical protein
MKKSFLSSQTPTLAGPVARTIFVEPVRILLNHISDPMRRLEDLKRKQEEENMRLTPIRGAKEPTGTV